MTAKRATAGRSGDPETAATLDAATEAVLLVSRVLIGVAARSLTATEAQLTLPQYRALVVLVTRGPHNVGALADELGIHPTTLTRLCDRLVAKDLIHRSTSPENRREVTLTASDAGAELVRAETARRTDEIREIVARLDRETQLEIVDAFGALADIAAVVPHHAWRLGWTA
jgi:DNA-binding MarR family transcriptional regulator